MPHINAIGFDLFETLITVHTLRREEALGRMTASLRDQGVAVTTEAFLPVYRQAARQFVEATRADGKETHNRFWISTALHQVGHPMEPDDRRIAHAIEAYFSAFLDHAEPVPGTHDLLATLKQRYRLGLLSNFTHAPAVTQILSRLGLAQFFDVVLVSGQLGYRKPHPLVFRQLIADLGVPKEQIAFVGDNLDADVQGAQSAGIQPIWMTYVQAQEASPSTTRAAVPTIVSWQELLTLLGVA